MLAAGLSVGEVESRQATPPGLCGFIHRGRSPTSLVGFRPLAAKPPCRPAAPLARAGSVWRNSSAGGAGRAWRTHSVHSERRARPPWGWGCTNRCPEARRRPPSLQLLVTVARAAPSAWASPRTRSTSSTPSRVERAEGLCVWWRRRLRHRFCPPSSSPITIFVRWRWFRHLGVQRAWGPCWALSSVKRFAGAGQWLAIGALAASSASSPRSAG